MTGIFDELMKRAETSPDPNRRVVLEGKNDDNDRGHVESNLRIEAMEEEQYTKAIRRLHPEYDPGRHDILLVPRGTGWPDKTDGALRQEQLLMAQARSASRSGL